MKIRYLAALSVAVALWLPSTAFALPSPTLDVPVASHAEVATLTAWLTSKGCPNDAVYFVESASANNLDYRELVPIWIIESGCSKHQLYSNGFGFEPSGSLKSFASTRAAIAYVSGQLADGRPYAGKTLKEKIYVYNSVGEPHYFQEYESLFTSIKSN